MIKCGGEALTKELHTLFNKVLQMKRIPERWRESVTMFLFKKR